jgi:ADP-ribose pyrophosphatase
MKPQKQTLQFQGRVISVTTDEVRLPNGHQALLEVVHHPGGAAVVALDHSGCVCLLRQYRYVADGWLWELPAGKLETNEPPLATAQRELIEEAGVSAARWSAATAAHERAEVIEIHWVPFAQACSWALDGTIADCKSALGLLRARNMSPTSGAKCAAIP